MSVAHGGDQAAAVDRGHSLILQRPPREVRLVPQGAI
jgi:hypothetical protein